MNENRKQTAVRGIASAVAILMIVSLATVAAVGSASAESDTAFTIEDVDTHEDDDYYDIYATLFNEGADGWEDVIVTSGGEILDGEDLYIEHNDYGEAHLAVDKTEIVDNQITIRTDVDERTVTLGTEFNIDNVATHEKADSYEIYADIFNEGDSGEEIVKVTSGGNVLDKDSLFIYRDDYREAYFEVSKYDVVDYKITVHTENDEQTVYV